MASPVVSRVTLQRGGNSHDLQMEQVTVENLRRLFQVCQSVCACVKHYVP